MIKKGIASASNNILFPGLFQTNSAHFAFLFIVSGIHVIVAD